MAKTTKTIAVRTPEGRRAVLNADDYDARVHTPWDEAASAPPGIESVALDTMSLAELTDAARRLRIPGRGSWRTKEALREGISNHLNCINREG